MKSFPLTIIVYRSPREHRPNIIDLPIERTHAIRLISSESLNGDLDGISLHDHGAIDEALKIFRRFEVVLHVFVKIWPSSNVTLMDIHNWGN